MSASTDTAGGRGVAHVRSVRPALQRRPHLWECQPAGHFAVAPSPTARLYAFAPQMEMTLYGHLDRVAYGVQRLSLVETVAAPPGALPPSVVLNPAPRQGGASVHG